MTQTIRAAAVGLLLASVQTACGPKPDPRAMAALEVVQHTEPPPSCRLIGPIEGSDSDRTTPFGVTYEAALRDLRRKAVLSHGDHVVVDRVVPPRGGEYAPEFLIKARLFSCNGPADRGAASLASAIAVPSAAASSAAPPKSCEPECSPGYTCLRGTCVSACNPVCAAGQTCGADRICHPVVQ